MKSVTLEAKSRHGKNRITETQKRLPKWDGKTWRVIREEASVLFNREPGPWVHVSPDTAENADWFSRWVNMREDVDFTVTQNVELTGAGTASALNTRLGAAAPEGN